MALEMRETCETCSGALGLDAEAFVCSYECTFCPACASGTSRTCPNCAGELVPRPRRTAPTLTPRAAFPDWHEAVEAMVAEGGISLPEISIYRVARARHS